LTQSSARLFHSSRLGPAEDPERSRFVGGVEQHNPNRHGYTIVVEPGDSVEAVERESGCPVPRNTFDHARFGDPDLHAGGRKACLGSF